MGIDDPLHVTEGWRRLRHAEAKIRGLETELEHWKANHAEAVRLKRNCHEYKRAFLDALDEVKAERDRLKAENERLRDAARALIAMLDEHATGSFGEAEDRLRTLIEEASE